MNKNLSFIPFHRPIIEASEMLQRSEKYRDKMESRRSLRSFSNRAVDQKIIENLIMTASAAPSGAHKQPWTFCAIQDPVIKKEIREAAEVEEKQNYGGRMSEDWLEDLEPFGTDWQKPFLEIAPWLIVIFKQSYELGADHTRKKNYYVNESVGIATGILLSAIHEAGLVALTHTPSPMNFLEKILRRPVNEKAFLLIPVGYPAENAMVPDLKRKPVEDVIIYY